MVNWISFVFFWAYYTLGKLWIYLRSSRQKKLWGKCVCGCRWIQLWNIKFCIKLQITGKWEPKNFGVTILYCHPPGGGKEKLVIRVRFGVLWGFSLIWGLRLTNLNPTLAAHFSNHRPNCNLSEEGKIIHLEHIPFLGLVHIPVQFHFWTSFCQISARLFF